MELQKSTVLVKGVYDSLHRYPGTPKQKQYNRLWVNAREISPVHSWKLRNHSPYGFDWGYAGSGAAQTALAMCLYIYQNEEIAKAVYQDFKFQIVARWPQVNFHKEVNVENFTWNHLDKIREAAHQIKLHIEDSDIDGICTGEIYVNKQIYKEQAANTHDLEEKLRISLKGTTDLDPQKIVFIYEYNG